MDNNRHARVDREENIRPQRYIKCYRQQRNAECIKNSLSQKKAPKFVIQYQMIIFKHTSNIIQMEQVIFRNMYIYMHICVIYIYICMYICKKLVPRGLVFEKE